MMPSRRHSREPATSGLRKEQMSQEKETKEQFRPDRSPCCYSTECEHLYLDKLETEPCATCKRLALWQEACFRLQVTDLPDFSTHNEDLNVLKNQRAAVGMHIPATAYKAPGERYISRHTKRPKHVCVECDIKPVKKEGQTCRDCRYKKMACIRCGKIGVRTLTLCDNCYTKRTKEHRLEKEKKDRADYYQRRKQLQQQEQQKAA